MDKCRMSMNLRSIIFPLTSSSFTSVMILLQEVITELNSSSLQPAKLGEPYASPTVKPERWRKDVKTLIIQ